MAFAVYTSALLVTAIFAWLAIQYNVASSVAQLAIALTGNGLGGFALVLGILRDDRVQKAEEETAKARQETAQAKQRADEFQKLYVELQQQAEQQRQRAERAETELQRLRTEHDSGINARLRRLEIAAGITPPDASDDATEI